MTLHTNRELYLKTYDATSIDEISLAYKNWAPFYDEQMDELGWQAPEQVAHLLASVFSKNDRESAQILDVGAGTGLVGVALKKLGFKNVDAMDISIHMLEAAKARKVYNNITLGNAEHLSKEVNIIYDAVICVGALNFGHIAPEALLEFCAVVKPQGFISFSTREDYFQLKTKAVQEHLVSIHKWKLMTHIKRDNAISDMGHRHWLYQKIDL